MIVKAETLFLCWFPFGVFYSEMIFGSEFLFWWKFALIDTIILVCLMSWTQHVCFLNIFLSYSNPQNMDRSVNTNTFLHYCLFMNFLNNNQNKQLHDRTFFFFLLLIFPCFFSMFMTARFFIATSSQQMCLLRRTTQSNLVTLESRRCSTVQCSWPRQWSVCNGLCWL